jgi:hypothetical protein
VIGTTTTLKLDHIAGEIHHRAPWRV